MLDGRFELGHGEVADADHPDSAVRPWLGRRPLDEVEQVPTFLGIVEPEVPPGSACATQVGDDVDITSGHEEVAWLPPR